VAAIERMKCETEKTIEKWSFSLTLVLCIARRFYKNYYSNSTTSYYSNLLNKIREILNPTLEKMGTVFAITGVSANGWSCLSLSALVLAGVVYSTASFTANLGWFYLPLMGSFLLLIGGFFDIVDGSVARATKHSSRKGAFLDSTGDRISESVIFIGIASGALAQPVWCMIALALSFLVSYVRAKAESLGVELAGVGVGERAERILILAIVSLAPIGNAMEWAVIIVSFVAGCTVVHRVVITTKKLSQFASRTSI
jgi:archaetidylinositol phosphate synthase